MDNFGGSIKVCELNLYSSFCRIGKVLSGKSTEELSFYTMKTNKKIVVMFVLNLRSVRKLNDLTTQVKDMLYVLNSLLQQ